MAAATGASGGTRPIAVVQSWSLRLLLGDTVGEGAALARRVAGVLVPGALGIKEPVELLLVERDVLMGSVGDGDGRACAREPWMTQRDRSSCRVVGDDHGLDALSHRVTPGL